jgi:hypothetical protein
MSNSIWKMPVENPDMFRGHRILVIYEAHDEPELMLSTEYVALTADRYVNRWCYWDEFIAQADKAERLQKAVDFLSGHLRDVLQLDEYGHIKLDEITKQQIKTAISDPVGIIMQLEQESNN